ncbi:Histone-lysine N-methyltransferase SET5 [Pleurotus pulmonarius]
MGSLIPSEDELTTALIDLKTNNPQCGIAKIHALLLISFPTWLVSEKRTRKILQLHGLVLNASPSSSSTPQEQSEEVVIAADGSTSFIPYQYPASRVIKNLDLQKWTLKVRVKYFDKKKGKGLVAMEKISKGEVIWKEDPFILAPEWEIYDLQHQSAACGFCSTPFATASPLITSCPGSSSSSAAPCPIKFCSRLCLARSKKHHPLLCPSQNPSCVPLLKFARDTQWMALHALSQCTSRILLANQIDDSTLNSDWQVVKGLAELGMEERFQQSYEGHHGAEPDRVAWQKAHTLFVQAFSEPPSPADQKKLAKLLKKPLREDVKSDLFNYKSFLRGLGRMSLNLEAHGGLYVLHSHLNHSCSPNVSVRHLEQKTMLSRITVIAKQDIQPGEELTVTYVNPAGSVTSRQIELESWAFGKCKCARCTQELKELAEKRKADGEAEAAAGAALDDLERELKAGLGLA